MNHQKLIAHCKNCGNSQLKVFFKNGSIGATCLNCSMKVFEVSDFAKFSETMAKMRCSFCEKKAN